MKKILSAVTRMPTVREGIKAMVHGNSYTIAECNLIMDVFPGDTILHMVGHNRYEVIFRDPAIQWV